MSTEARVRRSMQNTGGQSTARQHSRPTATYRQLDSLSELDMSDAGDVVEDGEADDLNSKTTPLPPVAARMAYSYGLGQAEMPENLSTTAQAVRSIADVVQEKAKASRAKARKGRSSVFDDSFSVSDKHTEETSPPPSIAEDVDQPLTNGSRASRRKKTSTAKGAAGSKRGTSPSETPSRSRSRASKKTDEHLKPLPNKKPTAETPNRTTKRGRPKSKTPVPQDFGPDMTMIDQTWSGPAIKFGDRKLKKVADHVDQNYDEQTDDLLDETSEAEDKYSTSNKRNSLRRSSRKSPGASTLEDDVEDVAEPGFVFHAKDYARSASRKLSESLSDGYASAGQISSTVLANVQSSIKKGNNKLRNVLDSTRQYMASLSDSSGPLLDQVSSWLRFLFSCITKLVSFTIMAAGGLALLFVCLTAARHLLQGVLGNGYWSDQIGFRFPDASFPAWAESLPEFPRFSDLTFPSLPKITSLPSLPSLRGIPIMHLPDDVIRVIHNRLSSLERQVVSLERQQSLHQTTIDMVRDIFPMQMAVKKDKHGEIIFPSGFWEALKEKISDSSSNSQEGKGQWDDFLKANDARIQAYVDNSVGRGFDREWKSHIQNNHILTEGQIIDALNQQYDRLHSEISSEARRIEDKYRRMEHSVEKTASAVATQVAKSVSGVWQRHLPSAQIDALAQASQRLNKFNALKHINFLSPTYGAVINPHLTSSTYRKPHPIHHRILNALFSLGLPEPLPPAAALTRWEEAGDCWCTSSAGNRIPQLSLVLPTPIYPSEITIEHIPTTATLDPGAAPRYMELWAQIYDDKLRNQISKAAEAVLGPKAKPSFSASFFSSSPSDASADDTSRPSPTYDNIDDELAAFNNGLDPTSWTRVARFKYDIYSLSNVQTFGMLADLRDMKVAVSAVTLRVLDNWSGNGGGAGGEGSARKEKGDVAGGDEYTCLYRVRLHGDPAEGTKIRTRPLYSPLGDEVEDVPVGFSADAAV